MADPLGHPLAETLEVGSRLFLPPQLVAAPAQPQAGLGHLITGNRLALGEPEDRVAGAGGEHARGGVVAQLAEHRPVDQPVKLLLRCRCRA